MKFLGIDYGVKRIGIAVSDDEGRMAFPKDILENKKDVVSKIARICEEEKFSGIVLGESLDYKGNQNPVMEEIVRFKKQVEEKIGLPVYFENEFMTSQQAKKQKTPARLLRSRGAGLHTKNFGVGADNKTMRMDDSAAAIILQSYLDKNQEIKKT